MTGRPERLFPLFAALDGLKGVGPARKRALLNHFGSPERFLAATREELESVPGAAQGITHVGKRLSHAAVIVKRFARFAIGA